jgi:hypothetical protein
VLRISLVFGDLDVPDADLAQELRGRYAGQAGEATRQVSDEPSPQLARMRVEQHSKGIVVAVRAQRQPEPRFVLAMPGGAGDVMPVRAAPGAGIASWSARENGRAAHSPGMDRPKGGGGQGGEHARVRSDRVGDALASHEPSANELAGIALVDLGAGRADRLTAVAARICRTRPCSPDVS